MTIQEILAEFNDTHIQVMSLLVKIPSERLRQTGTLPWYDMEYALDDVLAYMCYGHKSERSAQIAEFCDQLSYSRLPTALKWRATSCCRRLEDAS